MLMPDESQNLVPVMSAITMPAPPAMAELSSSPTRSALAISISAGRVTTTGRAWARAGRRVSLISGSPPGFGPGSYPGGRGLCGRPGSGHEPARPRQYYLQPRPGPHRVRRLSQPRPGPEADADGGQVLQEAALVIVPEQRRPGDQPVPRQLGGQPVTAERPQPVPHPHAGPARQPGQIET